MFLHKGLYTPSWQNNVTVQNVKVTVPSSFQVGQAVINLLAVELLEVCVSCLDLRWQKQADISGQQSGVPVAEFVTNQVTVE